jgi:hypothetical protein
MTDREALKQACELQLDEITRALREARMALREGGDPQRAQAAAKRIRKLSRAVTTSAKLLDDLAQHPK